MFNRTFVVWPLRNIADRCFEEYGINKTMHCHTKGSLRRGFWEFPPLSALLKNRKSLKMCKGHGNSRCSA